jgi:uncharacterized protein YfaS (alpha-2-macroglobulin family)
LPLGSEKSVQRGLTVNVSYRDGSGVPVDLSRIQQGTDVIAEIRIQNSTNNRVDNVALTHIIPGGFEIVNARFTEFGGNDNSPIDYLDIRDDRSNYYFSLDGFQTKTFTVRISASFPGKYYFPGTQADAMYDYNYSVRTTGRWIEILKY